MHAFLRRLWWLEPAFPFAAIVGCTIVAAHWQSEAAYRMYRTPKYVQGWHVALAAGAIAAFVLGSWLARSTGRNPAPPRRDCDRVILPWYYVTLGLTLFGYAVWLAIGVKNGFRPWMILNLITTEHPGADSIRHDLFPSISGVTTCTQFGVPAIALGLWLYFRGVPRVLGPLIVLVVIASIRAVLFNERTALIELFVPAALIVLRMCVLGRPWPAWLRRSMRFAPLVAPLLLALFFGSFEYFRSWKFYQGSFESFTDFTLWRLSGYYTTAHNNGAMAMETEQPRPLPYHTFRSLWRFPGVRSSPLDYHELTGLDVEANHTQMLKRYGNVELNNEGGFFQPTMDFGIAGGLLFWLAYGFVSGRFYRRFQVGTVAGVMIYPLLYLSILEVPLVLFVSYPRMFPAFITLGMVAWFSNRADAAEQDSVETARALLETS